MIDHRTLENLAKQFSSLVPPDVKLIQQDIEKQVRELLLSQFAKMNLVTREEFDIQTAVLKRTREKLERMESHVAELEKQLLE